MSAGKPKSSNHWPITKDPNNSKNQSKLEANHVMLTRSAGKRVRTSYDGFRFNFWLDEEVARVFWANHEAKSMQTRFTSGWQLKTALTSLLHSRIYWITLHAWYKVFEISWPNGCCAMNSGLSGLGSSPSRSRCIAWARRFRRLKPVTFPWETSRSNAHFNARHQAITRGTLR